jgi:hypothetical protein
MNIERQISEHSLPGSMGKSFQGTNTKNSTMSKSSTVPSFENCLGLTVLNNGTYPDASDHSDNENEEFIK